MKLPSNRDVYNSEMVIVKQEYDMKLVNDCC